MKKQTVYLADALNDCRIARKKPEGSTPLPSYETRSVKVYKKGNQKYVVGKAGFLLKRD